MWLCNNIFASFNCILMSATLILWRFSGKEEISHLKVDVTVTAAHLLAAAGQTAPSEGAVPPSSNTSTTAAAAAELRCVNEEPPSSLSHTDCSKFCSRFCTRFSSSRTWWNCVSWALKVDASLLHYSPEIFLLEKAKPSEIRVKCRRLSVVKGGAFCLRFT